MNTSKFYWHTGTGKRNKESQKNSLRICEIRLLKVDFELCKKMKIKGVLRIVCREQYMNCIQLFHLDSVGKCHNRHTKFYLSRLILWICREDRGKHEKNLVNLSIYIFFGTKLWHTFDIEEEKVVHSETTSRIQVVLTSVEMLWE